MTDISLQKIPAPVSIGSSRSPAAEKQEAPAPQPPLPQTVKTGQDDKSTGKQNDPMNRAAAIVEEHYRSISGERKRLTLEKHEDAGVVVYKAVDRDTGEIIKQFPPDSLLKLLSYYRSVQGLGVDDTV